MKQLIDAKLFGSGLLLVSQSSMVDRYNACLDDIGLPTTALSSFHIDGLGWSPEVAEEMENNYYLSHNGVANPYAIILSPQQEGKPVFFPYYSFDRDLMHVVFSTYGNHIKDLTLESGIWIDIDQEITKYLLPQDLLMIDNISLRFYTPKRLMKAARDQRALVSRFYNEERSWANHELLDAILASRKEHGDLRYKSLNMMDTPYSHLQTFYTRVFQGLFVIRASDKNKSYLVFENGIPEGNVQRGSHLEYSLDDPLLIDSLLEDGLLVFDNSNEEDRIEHLQRVLDNEIFKAVEASGNQNLIDEFFTEERKRIIAQLERRDMLGKDYVLLERLVKQVKSGQATQLDPKDIYTRLLFLRPSRALDLRDQNVLSSLLVKLFNNDVLESYYFDKEGFYEDYQKWSPARRKWSIETINQYREQSRYAKV